MPQRFLQCWQVLFLPPFLIHVVCQRHRLRLKSIFTSALTDGLSRKLECLQVSSSLQDSFQYSSYYHYCSNFDGLHSSRYFLSSSPFNNPSMTVPRLPITIGISVTCMFHNFLISLARSRYLSFFTFSFNFTLVSRYCKVHNFASSLILLIIINDGRLAEIR